MRMENNIQEKNLLETLKIYINNVKFETVEKSTKSMVERI